MNFIQIFLFVNGFLDVCNVLSHFLFNISWYSCVFNEDVPTNYLIYAFIYGLLRLYDCVFNDRYILSILTYLFEVIYFYNHHNLTSFICFCILVILLYTNMGIELYLARNS